MFLLYNIKAILSINRHNYQRFTDNTFMTVTFIRTVIVFIVLTIVMRLMGKRQIGEMQPFEFIVTLIIADLACFPMADVSIPLIYGIVAVLTLFVLHQIISLLEQKSSILKKIISGSPSVVINKNGVDVLELKKNNMGVDDLIESMRAMGYFSLDDLDYAIFESNGKLSALENQDKQKQLTSIPLTIVSSGKIEKHNALIRGVDKPMILNFLEKNQVSLTKTEILTIDENGRAYLKEKGQKYKILNFPLKENYD